MLEGHFAAQQIEHRRLTFERHGEANDERLAGSDLRLDLFLWKKAAMAIVARRFVPGALFLAHALKPLGRAKAAIGFAAVDQLLGVLLVELDPLALHIGTVRTADIGAFIPGETEPGQNLDNPLGRPRVKAIPVRIFNAENEPGFFAEPFRLSIGKEIIEERRSPAADMEQPGRAGGKAHAHNRRICQ